MVCLVLVLYQNSNHMKPGSLVVCVDDVFTPDCKTKFDVLPVRGKLYVVREIIPNKFERNGPDGVALEEVRGILWTYYSYNGVRITEEVHFKMKRFVEVLPPMDVEALLEQPCEDLVLLD